MSGKRSLKSFKKQTNKKIRRNTKQRLKKSPEEVYEVDRREVSDLADSVRDGW